MEFPFVLFIVAPERSLSTWRRVRLTTTACSTVGWFWVDIQHCYGLRLCRRVRRRVKCRRVVDHADAWPLRVVRGRRRTIWPVAVVRGVVRVHADVGYLAMLSHDIVVGNERLGGSPATEEPALESLEDTPNATFPFLLLLFVNLRIYGRIVDGVRRLRVVRPLLVCVASPIPVPIFVITSVFRRNAGRVPVLRSSHGGVRRVDLQIHILDHVLLIVVLLTRLEWWRWMFSVFVVGIVANLQHGIPYRITSGMRRHWRYHGYLRHSLLARREFHRHDIYGLLSHVASRCST